MSRWSVIGVPLDCSGSGRGEQLGPAALRREGLLLAIEAEDLGDVAASVSTTDRDPVTGVISYREIVAANLATQSAVAATLDADRRALVIGGDCSFLPGAAAAAADRNASLGLVYLDGHADYYDGPSSPEGEAADMPLAVITGRHGAGELVDLAADSPIIDPSRVVVVGYRDNAENAFELSRVDPGVHLVSSAQLLSEPEGVAASVSDHPAVSGPFWVHFDLDVLDGEKFPAVTYRQSQGPDLAIVERILAPLLAKENLVGLSVADLNPTAGEGGHVREVVELLGRIVG